MILIRRFIRFSIIPIRVDVRFLLTFTILLLPLAAQAQASGSPFDTGFTALQTLFTGTIAKVASLIAIVIGGYGFAHGEPGAKKLVTRARRGVSALKAECSPSGAAARRSAPPLQSSFRRGCC